MEAGHLTERLEREFASRGLLFLGIANLDVRRDHERFLKWLAAGHQASMSYLEKNSAPRQDPQKVLPHARTAIVFALPYAQHDESQALTGTQSPRIAKYARLKDYHRIMWRGGEEVVRAVFPGQPPEATRVCVDTAPLLERAVASNTGAGFTGKNTCFIAGEKGSFLLLGTILTTLELPPTNPSAKPLARENFNSCGTCTRCHVHCPTGALSMEEERWVLDSRKCLSYWTIEHRGTIPPEFWPWLGKYWYGCDICQDVCPFNRNGAKLLRQDLIRNVESIKLKDVAMMDDAFYQASFGGTAMTRAKRNGLRRNALIAMHVTNDPTLEDVIPKVIDDEDTVVRETAREIIRAKSLSGKVPVDRRDVTASTPQGDKLPKKD
ncbi:MAG: hypothetical protein RIQ81_112 [Pseudomonadota bacterium]